MGMLGEVVAGLKLVSAHGETRAGELFVGECDDGRCAVKLLRPELCTDRARVDRALAAAKAVGDLDHRGIEFVIEAAWDGDHAYLLGDIVPGAPLAKLAAQRRLDPDKARALLALAAEALAAAHAMGVHHGALELSLLYVGFASDRVVVRDFGLGELIRGDGAALASAAGDVLALGTIARELLPAEAARTAELVQRMLAEDPTARPTMADVRDELGGRPRRFAPPPVIAPAPAPPPAPAPRKAPDVAAVMAAAAAEANDEPTPLPGPAPEPADE